MKTKRLYLVVCVLLTFSLILTGCGGTTPAAEEGEEAPESIVIGAVYPLTGSNALLGDESLRGAQLAVDEINASGGLWGGTQVELLIADAPDVTAAQTEAERLITKEGVTLMFGAYSSGLSNVITDVCARYEVPYFELGAIGSAIMQKGYPYLFRTCAGAPDFGKGQAKFFTEVALPILGVEIADAKVAMAFEDSLYGTSVTDAAEEALLALGYKAENIKKIPYAATSVDLTTVVLEAKNFEPDGLISVSYVTDAILLARQAEEMNFVPPVWIGAGGGTSMRPTLEAVGKGMYGLAGIDFPQYAVNKDNIKGIDEFISIYKAKYGDEPRSGHSLANYAGIYIMADIINAAGSFEKDAIKDAAMAIDKPFNTYAAGWGAKFDETGQNTMAPLVIGQWTLDQLEAIWPEEFSTMDPIIPMPSWEEKQAM